MQEKTIGVAAASVAVGLNIHKQGSEFLRHNTTCTNQITRDGKAWEDVKTCTYLGSIIDEHGGSDADTCEGADRQSKSNLSTIEGHLELKITVIQYQSQDFQ